MILRYVAAALVALAIPTSASAATECLPAKVQRIWIGDGGLVWIFLDSSRPVPVISYNDPNREAALASADGVIGEKLAAAEREIELSRVKAMGEIEAVAAEAAADIVQRVAGAQVSADAALKAVKAVI